MAPGNRPWYLLAPMGDETRNLINSAESLLDGDGRPAKLGKDDSTASKLVAEADALQSRKARKTGPGPSTRQLVVEAEKLVGDRANRNKGGSKLWLVIAVAFLAGAVAVWFLMGRG